MKTYDKVGLALITDNALLLCRPHAFRDLLMPGGVREIGESDEDCLAREIQEELGDESALDRSSLAFLGEYEDAAAGPTVARVRIRLYGGIITGTPKPSSEIAELIWFRPGDDSTQLSKIIRDKIFPDLIARGMLQEPRLRGSDKPW